ncbi:laccase domain protein [Capsulimonas corticalis]|uniref:Purine nucleoside phosphorylase n=1 Tax=Capsulimonas corticalis TaxID=2219043 RepID=A0A402CRV9_9BACT|nr:peptidoglycan editing factor PgeF [Capsulimonas corticalis]BDI28180.1 laccase domain protein [Capsulimonas corticalis]
MLGLIKAPWKRANVGDLPVYQASTMSWLPGVVQGFTTRHGGVSIAPYERLNLGGHVGDDRDHVLENRRRLWSDLGYAETQVAMAEQVHGDVVEVVTAGSLTPAPGADALVTAVPDVLLMLYFADCVPVYFVDPVKRVVGLAHAGWRGTAANIAAKTLQTMERELGCRPDGCVAAIGPSISAESYTVGRDVADVFRNFARGRDVGAATAVTPSDEFAGKFQLNLRQILFSQLLAAGMRPDSIAVCGEDTCRNGRDFFSYRRDGVTGRMAAYLGVRSSLAPPAR